MAKDVTSGPVSNIEKACREHQKPLKQATILLQKAANSPVICHVSKPFGLLHDL